MRLKKSCIPLTTTETREGVRSSCLTIILGVGVEVGVVEIEAVGVSDSSFVADGSGEVSVIVPFTVLFKVCSPQSVESTTSFCPFTVTSIWVEQLEPLTTFVTLFCTVEFPVWILSAKTAGTGKKRMKSIVKNRYFFITPFYTSRTFLSNFSLGEQLLLSVFFRHKTLCMCIGSILHF